MLNVYDQWIVGTPEEKENWCDCDYVYEWVKKQNYALKTNLENLINNILASYKDYLNENNCVNYAVEDTREYPDNLMINIDDLECYVYDNGRLEEFDYFC